MEISQTEYSTKDIYLASTLIAIGYKWYRIEKNGRQCYFIFDISSVDPPKGTSPNTFFETEVDDYWAGNLLVDPKQLFNAFKELKARIYGEDQR
jgi:rubredoxin